MVSATRDWLFKAKLFDVRRASWYRDTSLFGNLKTPMIDFRWLLESSLMKPLIIAINYAIHIHFIFLSSYHTSQLY